MVTNSAPGMIKENDGGNRRVSPSSLGKTKNFFIKMKFGQRPGGYLYFPTTIC